GGVGILPESWVRGYHFIAGLKKSLRQKFDYLIAPVADDQMFGGYPQPFAEGLLKIKTAPVGINMYSRGGSPYGLNGPGRRSQGVLIGGQFDDITNSQFPLDLFHRFTGDIRSDRQDFPAD